jgi:predicted amidophosphoribosyltransferase
VRGAFAVLPRHISEVGGKTLVLIDDVLTTGATVEECTRVLLDAGAAQVHVLTLSRVKSVV